MLNKLSEEDKFNICYKSYNLIHCNGILDQLAFTTKESFELSVDFLKWCGYKVTTKKSVWAGERVDALPANYYLQVHNYIVNTNAKEVVEEYLNAKQD